MGEVSCRAEYSVVEDEKQVFAGYLERNGLSDDIWDLFGEWVARSTPGVRFFYLKVFMDGELIGVGLFLKIKPFDLRASYSRLRKNTFLRTLAGGLSSVARNCVCISFRNLITSNITRPFFFRDSLSEDVAMKAILAFLKDDKDADMVTILDTSGNDGLYEEEGFKKYPSSSEAYLDATQYCDVAEYLAKHRSLRRNLARKRNQVTTEIQQGPMSGADIAQMKACVACSVHNSRVSNPCQKFFEDHVFGTKVFASNDYLHIVVRVDGKIAGFHTFLISGSHMGGVLGGFDRDYSQKSFAYERVIVASLDHAIRNGISRVHYSLVDNYTKLRLVDCLEPCGLYFFSRNPLNRKVFQLTYRFNDVFDLYSLEVRGSSEKTVRGIGKERGV